jgi:predicted transcriptional regulator
MTEHFSWFWLIFLLFPAVRIAQRFFRKRQMKNYDQSSEKPIGIRFEKTSENTTEKPVRNLERPATTDMLVLGELNRGAKTFEKILKNTGLEREALNTILEELEKGGLMEVVQKQGLLGPKVELQVTEKGFKEFYS